MQDLTCDTILRSGKADGSLTCWFPRQAYQICALIATLNDLGFARCVARRGTEFGTGMGWFGPVRARPVTVTLSGEPGSLSASTCNQIATGELDVFFERSGSTAQSLGVFYKIINGTAVNGVDFNTPTTGEVIIPAGQAEVYVSVPLVNEGMFGSTKSFTAKITSTSPSITISPSTATQGILASHPARQSLVTTPATARRW